MINGALFTIPYAYRNFCFTLRCGIDSMRLVFHLVLVAVIHIDHKTKKNNNLHYHRNATLGEMKLLRSLVVVSACLMPLQFLAADGGGGMYR